MMHNLSFPPAARDLLSAERLPPLGPGLPNEGVRAKLETLTDEALCAPQPVRRPDFAAACLAGLWLYHDFLEESHRISQNIHTAEGSYWHGIMHRRELDYPNAAYWFRRVGTHPLFDSLEIAAREIAPDGVIVPSSWNPFWFIEYCKDCLQEEETGEQFARLVQMREWELLFVHCYRQAVGTLGH